MPTDSFQLAWAGPVARGGRGVSGQFDDSSDLVDALANTLQAGGWSLVERTRARAAFRYYHLFVGTLGTPIPEAEKVAGVCGWAVFRFGPGCGPESGTPIYAWDSNQSLPPPYEHFEEGTTKTATFQNLLGKITLLTLADARASPEVEARHGEFGGGLVAKEPGTETNGYCTYGDRWIMHSWAGTLWGGGYKLRSQTYNGTFIEVMITAVGPGSEINAVRLDWGVNSSVPLVNAEYPPVREWPVQPGQEVSFLNTRTPHTYTIVACPYQFAVWASDVDGDTRECTGCLASIPRVPVEHPGYGQAIILPHYHRPLQTPGGNMRTSLTWDTVRVSVGSVIYDPGNGMAGIAGFRLPNVPLLTAEGKPLLSNPYVWTSYGGRKGIIGQLWNCLLLSSDQYPRDSVMQWDGQRYLCMSKQSVYYGRAVGSLWLALNE